MDIWTLNRVQIGHSIAFLHFVTLWPWPFDLIFIGERDIMMDYPCAKFGDGTFSRFGFIVQTDRQNHTHTHTHANDRLTHATTISVTVWVDHSFTNAKNSQNVDRCMCFSRQMDITVSWVRTIWQQGPIIKTSQTILFSIAQSALWQPTPSCKLRHS